MSLAHVLILLVVVGLGGAAVCGLAALCAGSESEERQR